MFCAIYVKTLMVGVRVQTKVHVEKWTSRTLFKFLLIFGKQFPPSHLYHTLPHEERRSMMAFLLAPLRNVVLCHMLTKSLQMKPDKNQGINTTPMATKMVRTGREEKSWFSSLMYIPVTRTL